MKGRQLYNQYNALNEEGQQIFTEMVEMALAQANKHYIAGVDLRDARQVAGDAIDTAYSEVILRRAMMVKQVERRMAEDLTKKK